MFKELAPYLRQRAVLLTVAHLGEDQIRVNVIPQKLKEGENAALTTPLTISGTAEELDRDLPATLVNFGSAHLELKNTLDRARAEMDAAAKTAQAEARSRNKTPATKVAPNLFPRHLLNLEEWPASLTHLSPRLQPVWAVKRRFLPMIMKNSARSKRARTKQHNRIDLGNRSINEAGAGCHPVRSSASSELPKTSSRIIRSVASFRYSCNAFSI